MTSKIYKPKHKVTCNLCDDVIYSRKSGRMTYCNCTLVAIDETEHYCRFCGDKDHYVVDTLSKDDFREFLWTDIEGRSSKIKHLESEHLLNIVLYFEDIPKQFRNYFYELFKDEVVFRGLDAELVIKRAQNEIICGPYGPIANSMSDFSDEHLLFAILYIEEIGIEKNKYYYTLAMKELNVRTLEEKLVLERQRRTN